MCAQNKTFPASAKNRKDPNPAASPPSARRIAFRTFFTALALCLSLFLAFPAAAQTWQKVTFGGSSSVSFGTLTTNDFCAATSGTAISCTTAPTGTGSVVLSASPTLSGTITGGTFSGSFSGNGSALTSVGTSNLTAVTGTPSATTFLAGNGTWTSVSIGTGSLTGTVTVPNGGTGDTSLTAGSLLLGSGTSAVSTIADVATGSVLVSGGVGANPSYSSAPTISGANITGIGTSNLTAVTGTPSATTFLSGSGIWSTPSASLPSLTSAYIWVGNGSNVATGVALSGDCTITNAGVITCTKTNNVAFGTLATLNAAPAGTLTGTALASNVVSSSLTGVGTITSGIWNGTGVGIGYGGTNATSQTTNGVNYYNGTSITSGSNFVYSSSQVGLGTATPQGELTVWGGSTVASAASATLDYVSLPAATTTITGTTGITNAKGFNAVSLYKPTYTDSSAVTVTNAATLYIDNAPAQAGSVTITTPLAFDVNAGSSYFGGNVGIGTASPQRILQVRPTGSGSFFVNGYSDLTSGVTLASANDAYTGSQPLEIIASLTSIMQGSVGIGSTAPVNTLDVNGTGIHIASGTPGSTTYQLYNNGGTLTWNGTALATGGMTYPGAGIPQSTGSAWGTSITAGTGVVTALGNATNGTGGFVTYSGALGTPTSGNGSNLTSLNGSNISSGTVSATYLPTAAASDVQAGTSSTKVATPAALSGSQAILTLTYGTQISWNMASGYNAVVTLTGSGATIAAPTNYTVGQTYTLQITQDSTGSRTIGTWPTSFDWGAAGAPTLTTTASKTDLITLICVNSSPTFYAAIAKGF
ncbi:MAG: beta strand repeat-containing protein [Rhodomicrobium sp.]